MMRLKKRHEIDLVNLFDEEEQLPFYNPNINPPPKLVLDYEKIRNLYDVNRFVSQFKVKFYFRKLDKLGFTPEVVFI